MYGHRLIRTHVHQGVCCARLVKTRFDDPEVTALGDELVSLAVAHGHKAVALSLGPGTPNCLFSVFLSRLIAVRNALRREGAGFVLCEVSDLAHGAFAAVKLDGEFVFVADFAAAAEHFARA